MKSKIMSKMRKLDKVLFCSLAKVLPPNEAGNEEQVFSCHTNVLLSACFYVTQSIRHAAFIVDSNKQGLLNKAKL